MPTETRGDYEVGYGKPPRGAVFKKGCSGNPPGAPARREEPDDPAKRAGDDHRERPAPTRRTRSRRCGARGILTGGAAWRCTPSASPRRCWSGSAARSGKYNFVDQYQQAIGRRPRQCGVFQAYTPGELPENFERIVQS
jgi:hypothetical protein